MSEASQTWTRPTFEDSSSATSSPALECGATPLDSPDGPMIDLFGREVVLAPASQPQEKAKGLQTLVTSGHIGHPSSGSAALQLSLESRLHQRLDMAGSTLFTLTWKRRRTPLGRSYLERQASVRRTNAKDCTSVPILASVPTPMSGSPATETYNAAGNNDYSRKIVELASTATPAARDYRSESATDEYNETRWNHKRGKALSAQVTLSETGVDPDGSIRQRLDQLPRQAQLADSGATATGGTPAMKSTGQLNPDYSRWLMGLPIEFSNCADTAMRSFRKLRRNSSSPPTLPSKPEPLGSGPIPSTFSSESEG